MLPVKSNLLPTVSRFFDDDWSALFDWTNRNYLNTALTVPSVNIKETKDDFLVEMAAPGMKKEDFQIEIFNNVLSIRSEVKKETTDNDDDQYTRKEFSYQSFQRSFNLNQRLIDDSKIKATYKDGILHLQLPKKEAAKEKPARSIKIS